MYIRDGSPESYNYPRNDHIYSWGWLGDEVPQEHQWTSPAEKAEIVGILKDLDSSKHRVRVHRGFHRCEMCQGATFNGSIEIVYKDKRYCCPWGVWHYIEDHDYCPPPEVREAIREGGYCDEVPFDGFNDFEFFESDVNKVRRT